MDLSTSRAFFELTSEIADPNLGEFDSIKGRIHCVALIFEKLAVLPFALFSKTCKTFSKAVGIFLSAAFLAATLGSSGGVRELFVNQAASLAKDLADWVLFPFAIFICFSKLLFASIVHPAVFFRY